MNSIDIIKKHLSKEVQFKLNNIDGTEDIIMLKPLTIGEQTLCISISKRLDKMKKEGEIIDESSIKEMFGLFSSIIKRSIPGIDETTLENFILTNFEGLSKMIEKLMPSSQSHEKIELIKDIIDQNKINEVIN